MKFDNINIQHCAVIAFCGIGFIVAVIYKQENLATAVATGLIGYLGGSATIGKGE